MAGAALVPTDLDPSNQTRSDARRAYYDPYATRNNFHVITGQHVTRVLIEGVEGADQTNNPTNGGNLNGNGPASGGSALLGFNAQVLTPADSGQPNSRRTRRQSPTSSNLRITGIEVSYTASASLRLQSNMIAVCAQRDCSTSDSLRYTGGYYSRRLLTLGSALTVVGYRTWFTT